MGLKKSGKEWSQFAELVLKSKNEAEVIELLNFFLTAAEQDSLIKRSMLVGELLKGEKPQREIAARLGLSISKITAGSNALKRTSGAFRERMKQIFTA